MDVSLMSLFVVSWLRCTIIIPCMGRCVLGGRVGNIATNGDGGKDGRMA